MKSIFTKLSTLVLCGSFAMVGCSDFSADLKELNGRFEDLAATTATKTEVAALKASIEELQAKLAEQYATKAEVTALGQTVTTLQGALNTAKTDLQAAIDKKASKEELTAAVTNVQSAITELTNGLNALSTKNSTLETAVATLKSDLASAQAAIQSALDQKADVTTVEAAVNRISTLETNLSTLEQSLADYAGEVNQKFADVQADIEDLTASVDEKLEQLKKDADAADAAVLSQIQAALATINSELSAVNAELSKKADEADLQVVETSVQAVEASVKALETAVASIKADATALSNSINTALAAATTEYKALAADLQSQIDDLKTSLGDLVADVENMKSELRSVVAVPQTMYNGTKAVKFHRIEGENVLKTYADVSYHFNPSNFDATKATYEIVAEPVEFMTKAVFAEEPAIEIVGAPVQENGKVTFHLERAEGTGNMFALKVTLEDGCVIYSDYTAILDEATYAVATATASFPVERIAFELPKLNSITAIVDFVQSLGTAVEDFESTINAIKGSVEAIQNNDLESVLANLVDIPGIKKVNTNITATASYKVQVETLDAEEIIELLQNAQTIDEIRTIINDLLGKANGLGEVGSTIVDGLNNAFGNSGLSDLLGQYDNLQGIELPSLILSYEQAAAKLNQYEEQLAEAKAEYEGYKAEMAAIVGGLSAEKQAEIATLQAELDDLNAQYETASGLNKAIIWGKIEAKELEITTIAGAEYFVVKAKYDLAMSGVATAELLLQGAKDGLKVADDAVKKAEEQLANLETEILNKIKNYIFDNTELGQYIKELENALAEQGWEAKKAAAKGVAELGALDAVIAGLIQNYNAANEAVIADFANSLFGRFAYLIQTEEAAQAFEAIGLTEVYVVLKQLPEVIEFVIKYYPTGADFSSFENWNDITSILSNYITELIPEMNTAWEVEYLLAE